MTAPSVPEIVRVTLPTPFPVGSANAFLIKSDPPILIDVGAKMPEVREKLAARLNEHGLAIGDIGIVLLTHGHLDHAGMAGEIIEASGAQVYAHPDVVDLYRSEDSYARGVAESQEYQGCAMRRCGVPAEIVEPFLAQRVHYNAFAAPAPIQHAISDGDVIAGFTAYFVPGHSATDTLYFHSASRVAFTGDHLLKGVHLNALMRKSRPGQLSAGGFIEYRQSLLRTRELDIGQCCPGHGQPFGDHRDLIDAQLQRHDRRTEEVRAALADGPLTPYQLLGKLMPGIHEKLLHMGLSAITGHLEVLEERGIARAAERDGVLYCSLAAQGTLS